MLFDLIPKSIFWLSFAMLGTNLSASESLQSAELIITPMSCHVKTQGDTCHVKLNISWHASKPINPCLYKNNIKETCWFNRQGSEIKLAANFDKNLLFTLQENNKVIAQQVVTINSQAPRYRRRLRADWSIF